MLSSRLYLAALLALLLGVLIAGCAANSVQPAPLPAQSGAPPQMALPPLPSGLDDVKRGTMMDNDTVLGDAFIDSQDVTGAAGVGHYEPIPPDPAWAIYQIAKRPDPAIPYALTITGRYLDPIPQIPVPGKGFWVAWSNYTAGRWEWSGPYTQDQVRIVFPTTMLPYSSGGFIYAAVVELGIQKCNVSEVQAGYFTGLGFEDYMLGAPQGEGVGSWCDIQLDPAGVPQIAYMYGADIGGTTKSKIRIASLVGGSWEHMDVDTPYFVKSLQFAIGDNGLRALAVQEDVTHDLHVLVDDGSGTFASDFAVVAPSAEDVADITFINGTDNPAGDLDTVLCVYTTPAGAPMVQTGFFRLTLPALPVTGLLLPANSREPGRISLTRRADGRAVCAVPEAPAYPLWDAVFGVYSAATDTWGFAIAPNWAITDIDEGDFHPEVVVRELPGGDLTAGYVADNSISLVLSRMTGGIWSSNPLDTVYTAHQSLLDFEAFPDGRVGVLANTPTMSGTLYIGTPGSGSWQAESLLPFSLSNLWSTLAIDSAGVCHIAVQDPGHGVLFYITRAPDGTLDSETVDLGGEASGTSPGPVAMAEQGNSLHVYYTAINHYRILHAENQGGIWVREGEVVSGSSFGEYPLAAGYISGLDLLWVTYLNPLDYSMCVATKPPAATEWQNNTLIEGPQEIAAFATSDTELGALCLQNFMSETALGFVHGDPREGPFTPELASYDIHVSGLPWLGYDAHADQWVSASQSDDDHACLFYQRDAPAAWSGPYMVALQPGGTGVALPLGITIKDDGTRFVLVRERPDGVNTVFANVYSAPPDSTAFSLYGGIAAYDTTLGDVGMFVLTTTPDGEPVAGIAHKALADPTWTFSAYASDGAGNFPLALQWVSPIIEPVNFYGSFALARTAGGVALAAAEDREAAPTYGRVYVHYPW